MKRTLFLSVILGSILIASMMPHAFARVALVKDGNSTFTIVLPVDAPTSVQNAAAELQLDIELASGIKLPIQNDSVNINSSIISLGETQQAKSVGLSTEEMADESFRIVTKDGSLYILGPDTPDGGWTAKNGTSAGTANGVYSFLEDYLGVRWLMPGDIGRDVPRRNTFMVGEIDHSFTPKFSWRLVTHLWDYSSAVQQRSIGEWRERQRLGGAVQFDYDHNWWRTVNNGRVGAGVNTPEVRALHAEHPEWFAMDAEGKRPYPNSPRAKFETTNQELVQWFADKAITALKSSERPISYSLSPSDGGGRWSKSPESVALYDPAPSSLFDPEVTSGDPGMSSLVLKWYHDVSEIVAKKYPQGRLAGYIYSSYVYPPTKISARLPDNFTPVICGIGTYGYGLYRPDNIERWQWVMDSWAKVAPQDWYYYDLPNQLLRQDGNQISGTNFPGSTGIITPAAPDILNTVFAQLIKSRIKGARIYGVPSWSNAALGNYLLAKMEWDPTQDAEVLQREWLIRAYGDKAGAVMEGFYQKLNNWFREYYNQQDKLSYELTTGMLKDIYAAHYPELEKILLQAKIQPMTEVQKRRLQLIEDNLIVLQWRLRNAGFLSASFFSPLQRSDIQVNTLLAQENEDFPNFPGATISRVVEWNSPKPFHWDVQLTGNSASSFAEKSTFRFLTDSQFLIYASQDGNIHITPQLVTQGAYFPSYEVQNAAGERVASGILSTKIPIVISAKKDEFFVLTIPNRKTVNYQLRLENATIASGKYLKDVLLLSGKPAAVHVFYTPQNAPVGVFEEDSAIIIKKPFSGAMAISGMEQRHTNVRVLNALDDGWKFSSDPDNDGIARGILKADFDDSKWNDISVLDWWQMQGFSDYHGVAWYRIKFIAKPLKEGERARIFFGAVDGDAEVYLNGEKLAERLLHAPDYKGWDRPFSRDLGYVTEKSSNYKLKSGENILAVKVTSKNDTSASGIFKGVAIVAGTRK